MEHQNLEALKIIRRQGFKVLLWLPYYSNDSLTEENIQKLSTYYNELAKNRQIDGLSFAGEYYGLVKKLSLPADFPLFTWFLQVDVPLFLFSKEGLPMLKDPALHTVLLEQYGHYHR